MVNEMMKFKWLMLVAVLFSLGACASTMMSEADRIKLQQEKANAQKAESDKSFKELDRVTK